MMMISLHARAGRAARRGGRAQRARTLAAGGHAARPRRAAPHARNRARTRVQAQLGGGQELVCFGDGARGAAPRRGVPRRAAAPRQRRRPGRAASAGRARETAETRRSPHGL
jgi:hypothetical protein